MQQTAQDTPERRQDLSSPELETLNLLSPIGYRNSSCGYCGNKSGSYCYYVSSDSLTAQFYEDLLCRGWRRSGTLLYRPDQRASCCPHYTIRLDASAFRAAKEQRQAVNRFNRYVLGEDYIKGSAKLHPRSKVDTARRKTEFDLSERIHECEYEKIKLPPEPAHKLLVTLETDEFSEEKYVLFENYQRLVHHEPPRRITKAGFRSFLCSSPLQPHRQRIAGAERLMGSYHQCYRLDGKLVAIGVLDLLPHSVSGVYFMYHESIHTWSPGKLSALREIALAFDEGYRWYMMGFYIHSCKKMRYKVEYRPQYVLDPESYTWDLLDDDLKRRLDERKYVSLSRERRLGVESSSNSGDSIEDDNDDKNGGGATTGDEATADNDATVDNDATIDDLEGGSDDEDSSFPDMSLLSRNMPGMLPRSELTPSLLDHIKLRVSMRFAETSDLVRWDTTSIDDDNSIKGVIAELVSMVGTECAKRMHVVF